MKKITSIFILIHYATFHFAHPGTGLVQNRKGEIFYTDLSRVWKVSQDGSKKEIVVPKVHTHDLVFDQENNLYGEHLWYDESLKSKWGHFVWKYDTLGNFTKIIKETEGFRSNYSFTRDSKDYMYWIEEGKSFHYVVRKSEFGDVEIITSLQAIDIRNTYCSERGMLYYIDDNDLYKISLKDDHTPILIAADLDGKKGIDPKRKPNNNTMGIWDDTLGNVYIAVYGKKSVTKVDAKSGGVITIYTSPTGWAPSGGLIDKDQNLWVMEYDKSNAVRVKKININLEESGPYPINSNSTVHYLWVAGVLVFGILISIIIFKNIFKISNPIIN